MFPVVPINRIGTERQKLGRQITEPAQSLAAQAQSEPRAEWELRGTGGVPAEAGDLLAGATERPTGSGRRTHGFREPASPKMSRGFMPHSGALSSSPQPGSQTFRGPGVLPSEEGKIQPSQVEPELHPAPLGLLSPPPPTLSGPGLDGR